MTGKLILHIGNCKTGTTALQAFFELNRDTMAADGLYYPVTGTEYFSYNHWALMYEYIADYSHIWPIPGDYQRHPDGFPGLFAQLQREIDPQLSMGHDVLLSCEGLFFDNRKPEDVTRLLRWFAAYDLRLVVYLRRQQDMLDSMINELVKNGDIVHQDGAGEPFARDLIIPYHDRLSWWAEAVGPRRISVVPYEKSRYSAEHSLFDEFMTLVGHPRDDYQPLAEERNTAIRSLPGFLIMNSINRVAATSQQKHRYAPLVQAWESDRQLPRYTSLDPTLRAYVEQHSAPQNAAIAVEFLDRPDGHLFNDPPVAARPPPPADMKPAIEQLESFCGFLAARHPEAHRRLAAMIAASPAADAYGEYLGPMRILCGQSATGPGLDDERRPNADPDRSAPAPETRILRQRLQRCEQDLARALSLLEQYHQALATRPAAVAAATQPDFYRSRLYRYVARPIWKVTAGLRRLPGVRHGLHWLRR